MIEACLIFSLSDFTTICHLYTQAGRYMADFRKYSEKYPFRTRSETPEIAIELSLQPWRTFGVDGVIMFSGKEN